MIRYRKKPVVIEAMQFTFPLTNEFIDFCGNALGNIRVRYRGGKTEADIVTLEDGADERVKHVATIGDYIIKGIQGEFYPCKPDIFAQTYEPA